MGCVAVIGFVIMEQAFLDTSSLSFLDVWLVLTFQAGFNSAVVLAGTTFFGIAAGNIGTFALFRKRALVCDALSHCALPGIATAFIVLSFIGVENKTLGVLLFGGALSGLLGIFAIQYFTKASRLKEDAVIAVVLGVFFGFGVVLLSIIQTMHTGSEAGLNHFIYGQTASMHRSDAIISGVLSVVSIVSVILFLKEFRMVCFDASYAVSQGWPVTLIDLLMMAIIVLVTLVGFQSVGLLLIVALLIIPPVSARFWSENLTTIAMLSSLFGGLSGYLGATFSSLSPRMPAGAVIVLTAGIFFVISFLFAPQRGLMRVSYNTQKLNGHERTEY